MAYLTHSDQDRQAMLHAAGASKIDDLFSSIPLGQRAGKLDLPPPLGEQELVAELEILAARNRPLSYFDNFLGAGVYQRYIPALVKATISRPEFYSAYTPYQAEASQGTLQTIFEFQSMLCALTGLDVANASMYDGATAAAEAVMLAVAHTNKHRAVVAGDLHPEAIAVIQTFAQGRNVEVVVLEGRVTQEQVISALDDQTAAVVIAQPTFYGEVVDLSSICDAAHEAGALAIAYVDPLACSLLSPPGEWGADVAVGDAQPLGIPMSFGGPHCGFVVVRQELIRRIPGRLAGLTEDQSGRRAFTLTLQTREQHIRREKATSNICTNHALMALAATCYMAQMGAGGMRHIAEISAQRAHFLAAQLQALPGWEMAHPEMNYLWEFVMRTPQPSAHIAEEMRREGIVAGLPLSEIDPNRSHELLVCCTELSTPLAIARYVEAARAFTPQKVAV